MRVLTLGWELPPHFAGGAGIVSAALAESASKSGHAVTYLMPSGPDSADDERFQLIVASHHGAPMQLGRITSGLQAYDGTRLTEELPGPAHTSSFAGPRRLYGPALLDEVATFSVQAVAAIQETGLSFDVIHAHDWTTWPAGLALRQELGIPLVIHVHITEYDKTGDQSADPAVLAIESEGMQRADRVIAVSRRVAQSCIDRYGVAPEQIRVVYNALDPLGKARRRRHGKTVLFLGRVTLQKGPDYFLEAARRVLEHDPEVRFILAGAGDFWVPLIERAATLGIGDRVLFTGFVSREDVPDLMAMADLFVMPSVSEPFGLVALEAMEAGVPVLISRQSGVGEVVQHVLKADFWDIDDLAAKILAVLSYPELAQAIGRAGEEESRARTWADVAREVDSLYHEVRDVPATLPFAVPQPC